MPGARRARVVPASLLLAVALAAAALPTLTHCTEDALPARVPAHFRNRKLFFSLGELIGLDDLLAEDVFDGPGTTDENGEDVISNGATENPNVNHVDTSVPTQKSILVILKESVDPVYAAFEESRASGDETAEGAFIGWLEDKFASCEADGWCYGDLDVFSSVKGLNQYVTIDNTFRWMYNKFTRVFELQTDIPLVYNGLVMLLESANHDNVIEEWSEDWVLSMALEPDDPLYRDQWAMPALGVIDQANSSWSITTGDRDIVVAVLDTGVDYNHPDIIDNMWVNEAELNGQPGVDDDDNGYVDDIYGYNFVYGTGDPMDDHGHGTHCAGIVGATGNNGIGVSGVAQKVRIMALKTLPADGAGSLSLAVRAVEYALLNGAHITSNSYGGAGAMSIFKNVLETAESYGQLFVSAAGNEGSNIDSSPMYPAAYSSDINLAVAATQVSGGLASFSNYGATAVDVAAPGKNIIGLGLNSKYTYMSGTSMACPAVAGVAALMLAAIKEQGVDVDIGYGRGFAKQVRSMIIETVDADSSLSGLVASGGTVNAGSAMVALLAMEGLGVEPSNPGYNEAEEPDIATETDYTNVPDDNKGSVFRNVFVKIGPASSNWFQRLFES